MKYLGIDFGERRVGLSIGDSEFRFAFPKETIDQNKVSLWDTLQKIVEFEKVDAFVVGMPYHPSGRDDGKSNEVAVFVEALKQNFKGFPVYIQDESYSSVQALEKTSHLSRKKKKDKGIVDRAAASIILQNWLDENF